MVQKKATLKDILSESLNTLNRNDISEAIELDESSADAAVDAFADELVSSSVTESFILDVLDSFVVDFSQKLDKPVVKILRKNGMNVSTDDLLDAVHGPASDQVHALLEKLEEDMKGNIKSFLALYAEVVFRALSGNQI